MNLQFYFRDEETHQIRWTVKESGPSEQKPKYRNVKKISPLSFYIGRRGSSLLFGEGGVDN
jgi:hypothetical protein